VNSCESGVQPPHSKAPQKRRNVYHFTPGVDLDIKDFHDNRRRIEKRRNMAKNGPFLMIFSPFSG